MNDNGSVKLAAPIIVNQKSYHLNKSKSKHVTVGLAYDFGFQPCLTFSGNKCKPVVLNENEWRDLLQFQGILTNFFYSLEKFTTLSTQALTITFEHYNDVKFVKLEDKRNNYICLGIESLSQLWVLIPLIDYRLNFLKKQDFQNYFNSKLINVQGKPGDLCQQIINSISTVNCPCSENVSTLMELVYQHPNLPEFSSRSDLHYYPTY